MAKHQDINNNNVRTVPEVPIPQVNSNNITAVNKNVNNNPKLKFYNIGVWTEDGDIKFYHPDDKYNNSAYGNLSATNFFKSGAYIKLPCKSIPSIMKEHKHLKIDVLKIARSTLDNLSNSQLRILFLIRSSIY